jgi:glucose-1-phosphate cytidylyltransferase
MKVVLFCGGQGTRLRAHSETIPKPMVDVGPRPIVWHLMKHYAHYGHKDFILCLGYRGDYIKRYFLNYDEWLSNDVTISKGGRSVELFKSDIDDWNITFVDTGLRSNLGQRLLRVRHLLGDDEMFMANYSDGLSDIDMDAYVKWFEETGGTASFLAVHPHSSFHIVRMKDDVHVDTLQYSNDADVRINGGFFILRQAIFDYIHEGEELVEEPFRRLAAKKKLVAHKLQGFWSTMDTFKDKLRFDEWYASEERPWETRRR